MFKRVVEFYKGSNLPDMKYLGNTLQKTFGLATETHEEFSKIFRENCKYLGITSGPLTVSHDVADTKDTPAAPTPGTVTLAEPAGPAGKAGLKSGDVLIEYGGKKIDNSTMPDSRSPSPRARRSPSS